MSNFNFRQGTIDDKDRLTSLGLVSYGQFENILSDDNWNGLNALLSAEDLYPTLLKKSTSFVCEISNRVVGMAFLIPQGNPTEIFQAEWSYIRMVGVDPNFSGRGIGKRLTQMCIDHARASKEKVIALHTSEFMNAARHVYETLGFKQIKELPPRYGKKYWLYKLELA